MNKSSNFDFWLPQAIQEDIADVEKLSENFGKMDTIAKTPVAVQTNSPSNNYRVSMPFKALNNDTRIIFVPLNNNSGAATMEIIGFNNASLGVKKLVNSAGVQITTSNIIRANLLYLIRYDAAGDSGNGAFVMADASFVPLDGSLAMTGLLTLSGAPTANLNPATKKYTDDADSILQIQINALPTKSYVDSADLGLQNQINALPTKSYVDGKDTTLQNQINALPTKNYVDTADSVLQTQINTKAPLSSPALTGEPTAPTPPQTTNNTIIATTAFVKAAIAALINGAPTAFDTLKELADAMGSDPNFSTTILNSLAGKASTTHYHTVNDITDLPRHGSQIFTSNGVFTVPAYITTVRVTLLGAGAGGGGGTGGNGTGGGGGAGGAAIVSYPIYNLTPGQQITVTIGLGGIGARSSGAAGGDGGSTSFGTYISVPGGKGGLFSMAGGKGGTITGGFNGEDGGSVIFDSVPGGVGGKSALYGHPQFPGEPGAPSGNDAIGYGCGGSGSHESSAHGGNGSPGLAIVEW